MIKNKYDIVIIGAGIAGYSAALESVKLRQKTALIEKHQIGGTCLNRGCIPTKKLISESRNYWKIIKMFKNGILDQFPSLNKEKIMDAIEDVTSSLRNGLSYTLERQGVIIYQGVATIASPKCVYVEIGENIIYLETSAIIIATGSCPQIPKISGLEYVAYETTDTIFQNKGIYFDNLTIIGGGVIGVEFADAFSMLGKKIRLVEKKSRILDGMPVEISVYAERLLKNKNIDVICNADIKEISEEDDEIIVKINSFGKEYILFSDTLMIATGRISNTKIAEDSSIPIETDEKLIVVDRNYKTNIDGIYAIGDVSSRVQLAYLASKQGEDVINYIVNGTLCNEINNFPKCVFLTPEIASVGFDEDALTLAGKKYISGMTSLSANGKAVLEDESEGYIKILMDYDSHKIIGGQLVCERAVEISELLVQYISENITGEKILNTVFPHPSVVEDVKKAVSKGLYAGELR